MGFVLFRHHWFVWIINASFWIILLLLVYSVLIGNLTLAVITGYIGLVALTTASYVWRDKLAIAHRLFSNITISYSLFGVVGVSMGFVDALVSSWRVKAFIWLIFITILLVYIDIARIPLYLVLSGIIGMYGGFWSITWAIIWKLTGHSIDYNIWVLPNTWLPETIYWPIVFTSITIYFATLIYSYKQITQEKTKQGE